MQSDVVFEQQSWAAGMRLLDSHTTSLALTYFIWIVLACRLRWQAVC